MSATRFRLFCLSVVAVYLLAAPAQAAVVVYDLGLDFSNALNPNGVWSFTQGNTLLTHYTPVPTSLAPALANGYWGTNAANLNSSVMLSTAGGSAAPPLTNFDFIAGEVLVGTTDASTGGPVDINWTAPSNGTFTYSGWVWYADPTAGPFGNSFNISLNNGPSMEFLTASIGQNFFNSVAMVNGLTPTTVNAGDVVKLTVSPLVPAPTPLSGGVSWTIDFTPVPEPSAWLLMGVGLLAVAGRCVRRRGSTLRSSHRG
jgi:hypothetical protein